MITTRDKTREILAGMLTESTGTALCDSGGAYGRNWQRNAGKTVEDFEAEPVATMRVSLDTWGDKPPRADVEYTKSVFHALANELEYDPLLDGLLQAFDRCRPHASYFESAADFWVILPDYARYGEQGVRFATERWDDFDPDEGDWEDKEWRAEHERICAALELEMGWEDGGLAPVMPPYWGGDTPEIVNTYNGEDALSQIVQFAAGSIGGGDLDGEVIVLHVHGGCDARGGYTRGRVFRPVNGSDYLVLVSSDGVIWANDDRYTRWTTDDAGNNWYYQGALGPDYPSLREYPCLDFADLPDDPAGNPPPAFADAQALAWAARGIVDGGILAPPRSTDWGELAEWHRHTRARWASAGVTDDQAAYLAAMFDEYGETRGMTVIDSEQNELYCPRTGCRLVAN